MTTAAGKDSSVPPSTAPGPGGRAGPGERTVARGSHLLWGKRQRLEIRERNGAARLEHGPRKLVLGVPPGTSPERRQQLLERWYRLELRGRAEALLMQWEAVLAVRHRRLIIRAMRRGWGSCNATNGNIHLNTALVHAPPTCLDYVVLHELCHLLQRGHGEAFESLLASHMGDWRGRQRLLSSLPLPADRRGKPSGPRIGADQVGNNTQQVDHRIDPWPEESDGSTAGVSP